MAYEQNVMLQMSGPDIRKLLPLVQNDANNIVNIKMMDGTGVFNLSSFDFITVTVEPPDGNNFIVLAETEPSSTSLEIVDAALGELRLRLQGLGTNQVGIYRCDFQFWAYDEAGEEPEWSDGKVSRYTSAKLYYNVLESGDPMGVPYDNDIQEQKYLYVLQMLSKLVEFNANEIAREQEEAARVAAEAARVSETSGLVFEMTQQLQLAESTNAQCAEILTLVQQWYDAIVLVADGVFTAEDFPDFLSQSDLDLAIAALKADVAEEVLDGTIPVKYTQGFVIAATTPAEASRDKLWIDTAAGNVIKFWNGAAWVATATATFG